MLLVLATSSCYYYYYVEVNAEDCWVYHSLVVYLYFIIFYSLYNLTFNCYLLFKILYVVLCTVALLIDCCRSYSRRYSSHDVHTGVLCFVVIPVQQVVEIVVWIYIFYHHYLILKKHFYPWGKMKVNFYQ